MFLNVLWFTLFLKSLPNVYSCLASLSTTTEGLREKSGRGLEQHGEEFVPPTRRGRQGLSPGPPEATSIGGDEIKLTVLFGPLIGRCLRLAVVESYSLPATTRACSAPTPAQTAAAP
ncbi:unnamed protein product [Boreogadus saida]